MPSLNLHQKLTVTETLLHTLEMELAHSVDPAVDEDWSERIKTGIRPTGGANESTFDEETDEYAQFEADRIEYLFENEWKTKETDPISDFHYIGVGTGKALKLITPIVNRHRHNMIVYDSSSVAYEIAKDVFFEVPATRGSGIENQVFFADFEFLCKKRYLRREKKDEHKLLKIAASRVFSILDKQDADWEKRAKYARKMARTLRKIGRIGGPIDLFVIHPQPDLTETWGDTTPHDFEEIPKYIQETFKGEVWSRRLGDHYFYHLYTAALVRCVTEL